MGKDNSGKEKDKKQKVEKTPKAHLTIADTLARRRNLILN